MDGRGFRAFVLLVICLGRSHVQKRVDTPFHYGITVTQLLCVRFSLRCANLVLLTHVMNRQLDEPGANPTGQQSCQYDMHWATGQCVLYGSFWNELKNNFFLGHELRFFSGFTPQCHARLKRFVDKRSLFLVTTSSFQNNKCYYTVT